MYRKHSWIILLVSPFILDLYADQFSQFAEAHNVLDRMQLGWAIKPFPITMKIFGYVKGEGIVDSRQTFALRGGQLLYFPLEEMPDVIGQDINARGAFDEWAIQSRLDISGTGPDIGCMKSSFFIEADFFGRTDTTIDSFDLREALLILESENFNFIAGQSYHPICFPFDAPDTISFNCGIPIAPFALCPQFRLVYHNPHLEILAAANGFLGDRPFGLAGGTDKVFRDAIMPDLYTYIRFKYDEENYIGAGVDVMRLVPRLVTNNNVKEVSAFTTLATDLFIRLQRDEYIMNSKLMFAQDGGVFELLGGIAVHSVDPITDLRTYVPLRTIALFVEFIRAGAFEPGLFVGFAKGLGASTTIIPSIESQVSVFGIGTNINTVFRVSPRMRWYINSFIVGIEYEYTRATYGTINNYGKVENTVPVANNRLLFATYYVF